MDAFAATLGAFDVSLFVFVKAEDEFKGLLAIFAVELVARHGDLREKPEEKELYPMVYAGGTGVSRDAERGEEPWLKELKRESGVSQRGDYKEKRRDR